MYLLEIRTRRAGGPLRWKPWQALDQHVYFHLPTARRWAKKLTAPASGVFQEEWQCRVITFRRGTNPKTAGFADVNKELKRIYK